MLPNSKQQSTPNSSTTFNRAQYHAANQNASSNDMAAWGSKQQQLNSKSHKEMKRLKRGCCAWGYLLEHDCRWEERLLCLGNGGRARPGSGVDLGGGGAFARAKSSSFPFVASVCASRFVSGRGCYWASRVPTISQPCPYFFLICKWDDTVGYTYPGVSPCPAAVGRQIGWICCIHAFETGTDAAWLVLMVCPSSQGHLTDQ